MFTKSSFNSQHSAFLDVGFQVFVASLIIADMQMAKARMAHQLMHIEEAEAAQFGAFMGPVWDAAAGVVQSQEQTTIEE